METEDLAVMDPQGAAPSADDETHEVEHEGRVYRIPNALRGAFLMNADYTRKTQELADHRRALEQDRSDLSARHETLQASLAPTGAVRDEMGTGEWMRRRNDQTRKVR